MVTYNTAHQIISRSLTNSGLSLPASFAYNNNGQLISATVPFYEAIPLSFSYDASGELFAIQGGIGKWGYYNFSNYTFSSQRVGTNLLLTIECEGFDSVQEFEISIPIQSSIDPSIT